MKKIYFAGSIRGGREDANQFSPNTSATAHFLPPVRVVKRMKKSTFRTQSG